MSRKDHPHRSGEGMKSRHTDALYDELETLESQLAHERNPDMAHRLRRKIQELKHKLKHK